MAENLTVGQTATYEVVWFDAPNGTGNEIKDTAASTFQSDAPTIMSVAQVAGQNQQATVTGVAAGSANLTATSSTGVVAGFLDSGGAFQTGPLAFLVAAVARIVSGIIRKLT